MSRTSIARAAGGLAVALLLTACDRTGPSDVAAVLEQHCAGCHNPTDLDGGFAFADLDVARVDAHAETWEAVVRKLRTRTMPPAGTEPRPDLETYERLAGWLEGELDAKAVASPGRAALRRLNRAEYANSIRELLALDVDVASLLPPDDSAYGFDNNADLLVVSPALLERYLSAADRVSALAVGDLRTVAGAKTYTVRGDQSQGLHRAGLPLGTVGGLAVQHDFPLDAEYEFQVGLFRTNLDAIRGMEHEHELEIAVDGVRVLLAPIGGEHEPEFPPDTIITVRADATDARLKVRAPVGAGARTVTATFIRKLGQTTNRLRPFDRSNAGTYDSTGRPHVETLTITGPFTPTGVGSTASRERIFTCTPASASAEEPCAREILAKLARGAYRRPVTDEDVERLMPFYRDGRTQGSFDAGIQLALRRLLASPAFVFRLEQDPVDAAPGTAVAVSDVELASRLSFFLWSGPPDEPLLALAEAGELHEPRVLAGEVRRMLRDPRAAALVTNFAGQWLHLRNLDTIVPNTDYFPDFDDDLRQAFKRETELFFASIVEENRSILDLLTADYTFVDERLARHYGIPNVYGSRFRRVALPPELDMRRGLLGKGGVLMATSHADRTAPSLRGKWLLENLLGTPPPPPPANVPGLPAEPGAAPKTMRERLDVHRENPGCAGCHALIDPLGFALENFDAVGAWRTFDAGGAVDASGSLPDGTPLGGVGELRAALAADPRVFSTTFVEKLMIYALGRGLTANDMPVVRGILRQAAEDDYRFESVVMGIVDSPAFRLRAKADDAAVVASAD
jgi:hypothetical protein